MMKKRIVTLGLTFIFLVSTTGLPVTYHLCEMMEEKSLSECEVCMSAMREVEPACCEEKSVEDPITITSQDPIYCQDKFVYYKVEDNFIPNKSYINLFSSSENLFQPVSLLPPIVEINAEELFYCDSSPPFLINSKIHIIYLSLLI